MKYKPILIISLLLLIYTVVGAQTPKTTILTLENIYPVLEDGNIAVGRGVALSKNTTELFIKYFFGWLIIATAIGAFVSLVISGIRRLTSAGRSQELTKANEGITRAFIGLIIILSSYILFTTINPQIIKSRLQTLTFNSGVVSASQQGIDSWCTGNICDVNNVGDAGRKNVSFLGYGNYGDLEDKFGQLMVVNDGNGNIQKIGDRYITNFNGSPLDYIIFLGEELNFPEFDIFLYSEKGFRGDVQKVSSLEVDINKAISVNKTDEELSKDILGREKIIDVNYKEYGVGTKIQRPPLSMRVIYKGVGFYALGEEDDKQLILNSDAHSLGLLDDKVTRIRIKNKDIIDYLGFLFEDESFVGQFRMFFEKKEREIADGSFLSVGNYSEADSKYLNVTKDGKEGETGVGDEYGFVEKTSSISLYRISDEIDACKRVRVCTGSGTQSTDVQGECITYTMNEEDLIVGEMYWQPKKTLPMPLYNAESLPEDVEVFRIKPEDKTTEESQNVKFNDNVRSIKIEGSCLVILFQNKPDTWDTKGVGKASQLFIRSDYNLEDDRISTCDIIDRLGSGSILSKSCASGIVVFPIK